MTTLPTARDLAAAILVRVMRDDAWIAPTLTAELDRYPQLDARERGLTTEIVYGTTRAYHWLTREITSRTKQGAIDDPVALAHMLVAAYQVLLLDRVPAHAAIDAAVGAIKRDRDPNLAGFANAVLRRIAREAESVPRDSEKLRAEVARGSIPRWLRERTEKSIGKEAARAFFAERQDLPPVALRAFVPDATSAWITRLGELAPEATFRAGDLPGSIIAENAGRLETLEGFGDAWVPQDYGSQSIAHALGVQPGDRVLDACAGRGHKTAILAQAAGPHGRVDAADIAPKKLALHGTDVRTFAVDWSQGVGDAAPAYDRILVDAPCSGSGTIGRRPEILLRLRDSDLAGLRATQLAIATRVATLLAPGGTLLYSVCSVLREEGEKVVDVLITTASAAGITLTLDPSGTRRILPPSEPSDGYFLATLRRT